jgi:hypothetical protein
VASLFERLATAVPPPTKKTQESLFERLTTTVPPSTEKTQEPPPKQKPLPAQQLLDWLIQRWNKETVWMKDIRQFGPSALRDPKTAIAAAEALVRDGWLVPEPTRRYDAHKWRFVRRPVAQPLVADGIAK